MRHKAKFTSAAALLCAGWLSEVHAQELVLSTFGGSFSDAVRECSITPFEKATSSKVLIKLNNSSQAAAMLRATKGNPDVDLAFMDDAFAAQTNGEGINEPLDRSKISNAKDIIPNAWGRQDGYVAAAVSATVLVYDRNKIKTPPTSWLDLFEPAYAGKYVIGDISGTSGWQLFLTLNKLKGGTLDNVDPGMEFIKPLAKGSTILYTQGDQVVSLFERGEIALAAWYPDRAGVAIEKGLPLGVVYPKEGVIGILPTLSIPKGAKNKDLAYKFMDHVLSPESQKCFSERAIIGTVNTKVQLSEKVAKIVPYGDTLKNAWFVDPDVVAKSIPTWQRRWQREVAR